VLLAECRRRGIEGILCKLRHAPCRSGPRWSKVRNRYRAKLFEKPPIAVAREVETSESGIPSTAQRSDHCTTKRACARQPRRNAVKRARFIDKSDGVVEFCRSAEWTLCGPSKLLASLQASAGSDHARLYARSRSRRMRSFATPKFGAKGLFDINRTLSFPADLGRCQRKRFASMSRLTLGDCAHIGRQSVPNGLDDWRAK
jgi:hypothetical protein